MIDQSELFKDAIYHMIGYFILWGILAIGGLAISIVAARRACQRRREHLREDIKAAVTEALQSQRYTPSNNDPYRR